MQISRIELNDFKCFNHFMLDNIANRIILVGPNGCGKSAILESIALLKEYIATYNPNQNVYQQHIPILQRSTLAWRQGIPLTIRARQPFAEVKIELVLNEAERNICGGQSKVEATIKIERTREIIATTSHPALPQLLRSYDSQSGVGVFDYIAPDRRYQLQQVTTLDLSRLSDDQQRRERIELLNPNEISQKFASIKHFIISQQLRDTAIRNSTGEIRDSILLLKELFTFFFGPKELIGYDELDNEMKIVIRTPYGDHDIDELSSREKELFTIFTSLFRIRNFPGVVLYDEPERHLNPGLESKLIPALDLLHTNNQLWISTHSTELIGSVPLHEVVALRRDAGDTQPERFFDDSKTKKYYLFESVGASVGLQLAANRIIFLEGKQSHADKRILDRLAGPQLPGVLFIASGSSEDVIGSATRAAQILQQIGHETTFMMVLDRDYREEDNANAFIQKHKENVFMWACHELENVLIDPRVIWEVLNFNDSSTELGSPDAVQQALLQVAREMKSRFALEWATYRLHNSFNVQNSGRPQNENEYLAMAQARREKLSEAYNENRAQQLFQEAELEIEKSLSNNTWLIKLPGKEILKQFRSKYLTSLADDLFKQQIISIMVERKVIPGEVARLCKFIKAH